MKWSKDVNNRVAIVIGSNIDLMRLVAHMVVPFIIFFSSYFFLFYIVVYMVYVLYAAV